MTWLAIQKKITESDSEYTYIKRYMEEVPIDVQRNHNHFFPEYLIFPRIYIYINENDGGEAMLYLHDRIANPGEDAPGAVALFFENYIIPIHYTDKETFWNRETKDGGVLFEIMPFKLPDSLKVKQEQVKKALEEAFRCMQEYRYRNNQFIKYSVIEFSYNQPFIPVGNPR